MVSGNAAAGGEPRVVNYAPLEAVWSVDASSPDELVCSATEAGECIEQMGPLNNVSHVQRQAVQDAVFELLALRERATTLGAGALTEKELLATCICAMVALEACCALAAVPCLCDCCAPLLGASLAKALMVFADDKLCKLQSCFKRDATALTQQALSELRGLLGGALDKSWFRAAHVVATLGHLYLAMERDAARHASRCVSSTGACSLALA